MSKTAVVTREEHSGESLNIPTPDEIRQQLGNILASPPFHGSKRCHQFLEYVCEQALAGEVGALKERTIAIAVFGRQPQSDLGEDTIVRVGAREVRKRLAQYYVTPEGAASKVRIDLPSGAYAPEFHYITQSHEEGAAPATLLISAPRAAARMATSATGRLRCPASGAVGMDRSQVGGRQSQCRAVSRILGACIQIGRATGCGCSASDCLSSFQAHPEIE